MISHFWPRPNPSLPDETKSVTQLLAPLGFRPEHMGGNLVGYFREPRTVIYAAAGEWLPNAREKVVVWFGDKRTTYKNIAAFVKDFSYTGPCDEHCGELCPRCGTVGRDNPAIPPAPVRRVWKAVEDARPADRSKVAHAFSRNRLLAALSWNDRNGDYDRLDQDTLADEMVYAVNQVDDSDIGSRRNPASKLRFVAYYDGQVVGEGESPKAARAEAPDDVPRSKIRVKKYDPATHRPVNDGVRSWLQVIELER